MCRIDLMQYRPMSKQYCFTPIQHTLTPFQHRSEYIQRYVGVAQHRSGLDQYLVEPTQHRVESARACFVASKGFGNGTQRCPAALHMVTTRHSLMLMSDDVVLTWPIIVSTNHSLVLRQDDTVLNITRCCVGMLRRCINSSMGFSGVAHYIFTWFGNCK